MKIELKISKKTTTTKTQHNTTQNKTKKPIFSPNDFFIQ